MQNVFVSKNKMYLSQIAKSICVKFQNLFVSNWKYICLILQNIFVLNCKLYLSQIEKCIFLKLQNVFVSNCTHEDLCGLEVSPIDWSPGSGALAESATYPSHPRPRLPGDGASILRLHRCTTAHFNKLQTNLKCICLDLETYLSKF